MKPASDDDRCVGVVGDNVPRLFTDLHDVVLIAIREGFAYGTSHVPFDDAGMPPRQRKQLVEAQL